MVKIGEFLSFNKRYLDRLLSGRKNVTIRVGKVEVKPGKTVFIECGGKVVAKAKIVDVKYKRVSELTKSDAVKDGFRSRKELLKALKRHYGQLSPNTKVTIIKFRVTKRFKEKLPPEEARLGGYKPVEIARYALAYQINLSDEEKRVLAQLLTTGNLTATALALGDPSKRVLVRDVVKKAYKELLKKGLIKPRLKELEEG